MELGSPQFWIAGFEIIVINILLSGDNAVVIALACRNLQGKQRSAGIFWGIVGAVVLRVVLTFFAVQLLQLPWLQLAGAALLLWIGVKLIAEDDEGEHDVAASDKLIAAVKTIIIADLVMSIDNVIAIAGAAQSAGEKHQLPLVIFGLLVSIPIIVWGSQMVIKLMDRFPVVITIGGMLLGWIAGTMAVTDPAVIGHLAGAPATAEAAPAVGAAIRYGAGVAGALLVLIIGKAMAGRQAAAH